MPASRLQQLLAAQPQTTPGNRASTARPPGTQPGVRPLQLAGSTRTSDSLPGTVRWATGLGWGARPCCSVGVFRLEVRCKWNDLCVIERAVIVSGVEFVCLFYYWEAQTWMCLWWSTCIHLRKLLWVYCPGHVGVKGSDRADTLVGNATLTSGLLLGISEVLRSLRHYLPAQTQGHHTIDRLEDRGLERGRTREGHLQLDEHWNCFNGNIGDSSERRGGARTGFSARIDTILN